MEIKLKVNWQVAQHDLDPVLFQLLSEIQRQGSLQQAIKQADVSYRFAWGLLNKWQEIIGQPLVLMERGRGARLSTVGEKLLTSNQKLIARFAPDLDNMSTQFKREFETLLSLQNTARFSIFASHGLAISALRDLMHQQSDLKLDLHFHGSLESIRALEEKHCDIAGFHIPEGELAPKLSSHYLSMLNEQEHQLIYVVKRNQGLIVRHGNPKKITDISSLIQPDVQFINRQPDSGTRLLFDQLLNANDIKPAQVSGYDTEEFTHMAVAAMIASGMADVGFGIAPMADKFNLEFIPLVWEHYCLAVPRYLIDDPHLNQIVSILQGEAFKQKLSGFSGYDIRRSGQFIDFDDVFNKA